MARPKRIIQQFNKTASNALDNLLLVTAARFSSLEKNQFFIFDDIFPHPLSSFRIAEYNDYLENLPEAHVYSTTRAFLNIYESRGFDEVLKEYSQEYPALSDRIHLFRKNDLIKAKIAYTVFLNNACQIVPLLDRLKIPFLFTLYPGGGFQIDQDASDRKLRRVCSSPYLKKIITTQTITKDYLIRKNFCPPEKIILIFGVVLPAARYHQNIRPKKIYKVDKDTFDICFVANKYMPGGLDKGYDVFIETAKSLAKAHPDFRFHVVGGFEAKDLDISDIADKIRFHGIQKTSFFYEFYAAMDLILSPNIPFKIVPGAFDGFPTGACMEAGLCGVPVFCTDILGLNSYFKNEEEIVIIPHDATIIVDKIMYYFDHPDELRLLGQKGQAVFQKVYNLDAQMKPRMDIIHQVLEEVDLPYAHR